MFKIADDDGSKRISGDELKSLIKEIYANSYDSNPNAQKIVAEVSKDYYDLNEFKEFAKHHSALTMPLFDLQSALRKKVINLKFWMDQMIDRKELDKSLVDETLKAAIKILHDDTEENDNNQNIGISQNRKKKAVYQGIIIF